MRRGDVIPRPDDGREDVGNQLHLSIEVETVDGLDQPDGRDLDKVIELLAASGIASGQ